MYPNQCSRSFLEASYYVAPGPPHIRRAPLGPQPSYVWCPQGTLCSGEEGPNQERRRERLPPSGTRVNGAWPRATWGSAAASELAALGLPSCSCVLGPKEPDITFITLL